jgi:hypothetical protein
MEPTADGPIQQQLTKVLTSPEFQNSDRLCRFLRFIVDAKLRGEQDQLKEYLIGKEVFDRDGDYDPRMDPIVRVEARRLRKKLEAYYAGPGAGDSLRFDLPKGAYVPEIREPAIKKPVALLPRQPMPWLLYAAVSALLAGVLTVAAYFWPRPPASGHVVAIVPGRWIWSGNDFPDIRHDEDLAERVAANLAAQAGANLQVIAWPSIQRFRGAGKSSNRIGAELGITRMIILAVRVESDGFRVTAYMIDPKQDRKLNVADQRGVALDTPANREQVAKQLAAGFLRHVSPK